MFFRATNISMVILFVTLVFMQPSAGGRRETVSKATALSKRNVPITRKPNFVIILVDDMGWADVGCNGSTFYQTPNIDKLAAQLFFRSYSYFL